MSRYFFHIEEHGGRHRDREGDDYLHARDAEVDAIVTNRSLVQSGRLSLDRVAHWVIRITDEAGVTYATIPVQQALAVQQQ